MVVCQLDNSSHPSFKDLNLHLGRLRYKQETYYTDTYGRKDLLTKEPIPYRNTEQYFSQDFVDKRNLKKWLKLSPVEGHAWAIEWLKKRKEEKGLVYAPSHVELRSLPAPTATEFAAFGGYEAAAREVGLVYRYPLATGNPVQIDTILVDSREQLPLQIEGVNLVSAALKVGDYGLSDPHDKGIYIERKSLSDFIGTLGQGLARFTRELERAQQAGHYIVMLVETDITSALSFNYLPHIKRHVKAQPQYIFKALRDLLTLYPLNFQCLFVDGRGEAARLVKIILGLGEQVKSIDLQFAAEQGYLS